MYLRVYSYTCLQTRILITHSVKYLPSVDRIIVIKDGCISESGTYDELLKSEGAFSEFLMTYVNEENSDSDSEGKYSVLS